MSTGICTPTATSTSMSTNTNTDPAPVTFTPIHTFTPMSICMSTNIAMNTMPIHTFTSILITATMGCMSMITRYMTLRRTITLIEFLMLDVPCTCDHTTPDTGAPVRTSTVLLRMDTLLLSMSWPNA
jgi:hypothetical protein